MTSVGTLMRGRSFRKSVPPPGDAIESAFGGGADTDVPASLDSLVTDTFAAQDIHVVEICKKGGKERRPVRNDGLLDPVEDTAVHPLRVVSRLQQERREPSEEHCLGPLHRSISAQVAGHLAATHREADKREIMQVEFRHKLAQVLGEGVVVVACGGLAGTAESPAVVCDDPVTHIQQGCGLLLPGSAA